MQANTDVTLTPAMIWAVLVFLAGITGLFYFARKLVDYFRNRSSA